MEVEEYQVVLDGRWQVAGGGCRGVPGSVGWQVAGSRRWMPRSTRCWWMVGGR